ncbi:hypothetical protein Bbelb_027570 [Branchiostoma belcheri]|nr:hypothetical protein Bbelb_027570 [Branchiostoma belcheri]
MAVFDVIDREILVPIATWDALLAMVCEAFWFWERTVPEPGCVGDEAVLVDVAIGPTSGDVEVYGITRLTPSPTNACLAGLPAFFTERTQCVVFDGGTSKTVKATCYKALVRPHLEYSATVWDPYTNKGIQAVEAVQRRAARVTLNDYQRTSSVTQMLNDLQWPLLSERRRKARLTTFYKIVHKITIIPTDKLLRPAQGRTRGSHQYKYQPIHARTDVYKYSLFPRTIPQWNALLGPVTMAPTVESFRARLEACPPKTKASPP